MDRQYNLILEAYSSKKKNEVIFEIKSAISKSEAWISDFSTFSDKLIHFDIETEYNNLNTLYLALKAKEIKFYNSSDDQLKQLDISKLKGELFISLNISFEGTGKGDLGSRIDEI